MVGIAQKIFMKYCLTYYSGISSEDVDIHGCRNSWNAGKDVVPP